MQRIMLLVLLLILPVQWTWSAAASICRHESSIHANHFGHHVHGHEQASAAKADSADPADSKLGDTATGAHADCASCHGAVAGLVMQPVVVLDAPLASKARTPYQRSVTSGLPERLIRPPHSHVA